MSEMLPKSSLPFDIERPTLLLDKGRCLRNIRRMAQKAADNGVDFRPHMKTHQSADIAAWFRDAGVRAITVSSVDMAVYFANHGWDDITVAFPVNVREITKINVLAERIDLGFLVESPDVVSFLAENLVSAAGAWIKIDVGSRRTGIPWRRSQEIVDLARAVDSAGPLCLRGVLTHAGHSYQAGSLSEIRDVHRECVGRMNEVRDALSAAGFWNLSVSVGDTPTTSVVDDFEGVDEMRPGAFVFYDLKQLSIGSCDEEQIAVALACPVVAKHKERSEIVLYGGAVHLSKDSLVTREGERIFGQAARIEDDGWGPLIEGAYVTSVSQEHGILRFRSDLLEAISIGDMVAVLPVHCCLTADAMKGYVTLDGDVLSMARI